MKKLLIASLLTLSSMSSYAYEAKVICGGISEDAPSKIVGTLNKKIKEAIKNGFTNVSAPSIATGNQSTTGEVCVTISKN